MITTGRAHLAIIVLVVSLAAIGGLTFGYAAFVTASYFFVCATVHETNGAALEAMRV